MDKNKFYLNPGQHYVYDMMPRHLTAICSRRFGKTDGLTSIHAFRAAQYMPRGKSAMYGSTLKQALTRTIPGTMAAIERNFKFMEGIHFYVGSKAPKAAEFPEPFVKPYNWEHCMHWYTGHVTHILSQDIKFSANSLTLDSYTIDEARNIRKVKVDEELHPALSGTPGHFENCPLKKSTCIVSDRPITKEGQWVVDRESLATKAIVSEMEMLLTAFYQYKAEGNEHMCKLVMLELTRLRMQCNLYVEFDTIDNLEIVGVDYIKEMKRTLPPHVFAISIMNLAASRPKDGFYSAFNPEIHTYTLSTISSIENLRMDKKVVLSTGRTVTYNTYDFKRINGGTCALESDMSPHIPLEIALDYNANINWIVTGQVQDHRNGKFLTILNSMFVKNENKLRQLCRDWCDYHEPHRIHNCRVNFYYNNTGKQGGYADENAEKFHEIVERELRSRKWVVNSVYMGQAMSHPMKHQMLDDSLKGVEDPGKSLQKYLYIQINKENNEFLIAAMEQTGIKIGRNGFEKDKSGEKLQDAELDPTELRTDSTDAFDDLVIGCNLHHTTGSMYYGFVTT